MLQQTFENKDVSIPVVPFEEIDLSSGTPMISYENVCLQEATPEKLDLPNGIPMISDENSGISIFETFF